MSNRRTDRPLPPGFVRYSGEYDKRFYDVLTFNGVHYCGLWPNAGTFPLPDGRFLLGSDVLAIRPSALDEMGMPISPTSPGSAPGLVDTRGLQ